LQAGKARLQLSDIEDFSENYNKMAGKYEKRYSLY
jgi:hypothetical protein